MWIGGYSQSAKTHSRSFPSTSDDSNRTTVLQCPQRKPRCPLSQFVFLNQPRSVCPTFSVLLQLPHTTFCDHSGPTETISITSSSCDLVVCCSLGFCTGQAPLAFVKRRGKESSRILFCPGARHCNRLQDAFDKWIPCGLA